jgi:hypothetical protein
MKINWGKEIPKPLPDEMLAQIRRDARARNFRPGPFAVEQLGDRPRDFDPEHFHDDRVLVHRASLTSRRDDFRQDVDSAKRVFANHLPRKFSGCGALVLLGVEWLICRDIFMHMGWGALAANGLAILVTLATAVAWSAMTAMFNRDGRS